MLVFDFIPSLPSLSERVELALESVSDGSVGFSRLRLVNRSLGKGNVVALFGAGASEAAAQIDTVTDLPSASTTGVMMGKQRNREV